MRTRMVAVVLALVGAGCGPAPQGGVGFEDQSADPLAPPMATADRTNADQTPVQTDGRAPDCDQVRNYDPAPELVVTEQPTVGEGGIPTPGPTLLALIQGGTEEIQTWAMQTAPEEYGGMWLADSTVGPVVVAFSGTIQSVGLMTDVNRVIVGLLGPSEPILGDLAAQYGNAVCVEISPIPTAADAIPSPWLLPADADITPASTTIEVLVAEQGCHGSQPTDLERIVPPEVTVDDETVIVTIAIIPPTGEQTCPGIPPVPYMVNLGEPLGDRRLLDGSQTPPTPPATQTEEPVGPPGPQPTGTVTPGITPSAAAPTPLLTGTPIPIPQSSVMLTPSALPTGG